MLADLHMTSKDYKLAFEVNMALAYKTKNHFQTQHIYNRNVINSLLISSSVQKVQVFYSLLTHGLCTSCFGSVKLKGK